MTPSIITRYIWACHGDGVQNIPQVNSVTCVGDSKPYLLVERLHLCLDLLGDAGLTESSHALEAAIGINDHDARQDGAIDAHRTAVFCKLNEDLHIIEQLRDDDLKHSPPPHDHPRTQVPLCVHILCERRLFSS